MTRSLGLRIEAGQRIHFQEVGHAVAQAEIDAGHVAAAQDAVSRQRRLLDRLADRRPAGGAGIRSGPAAASRV